MNINSALQNLERSYARHPEVVDGLLDFLTNPGNQTFTIYACGGILFKADKKEFFGGDLKRGFGPGKE